MILCRWFTSYSGWGPGQLQQEVANGVWFTAAAGPGLLMRPVEHESWKSLWHEVLDCMGGEYKQLSKHMQTEYRADIMEWQSDSPADQQLPTVEPPDGRADPEAEAP